MNDKFKVRVKINKELQNVLEFEKLKQMNIIQEEKKQSDKHIHLLQQAQREQELLDEK